MTDAREALEQLAGRPPKEIDPGIFELSPPVGDAHYDRIAGLYDTALATKIYNRVVWSTTPALYRDFATQVFESRATGTHVELGCGSLLFTSHVYERDRGRPVVLIDQSLEMLRRARSRLMSTTATFPSHVVLARGDVRTLDLTAGAAATTLSMFVLHVLDEPEPLLRALSELARVKESTIGLTSLFRAGGRGNVFLALLHAAGELSAPRDLATIEALVSTMIPGRSMTEVDGSAAFIRVTR